MNLLDDKQLAPFRKEYLEREKEIQRYIGVYLSGVVIVLSWLLAPQSRPLTEMALGNGGYNIYAFLIISIVNALFMTFLIYKSLDVHDTTQFISALAKPNSLYAFWENWRRSKHSITKPVRTLYFIGLAFLPTLMAITMLVFIGSTLYASRESLTIQLMNIEVARFDPRSSTVRSGSQSSTPGPSASPVSASTPDTGVQVNEVRAAFGGAKYFFIFVVLLHLVPIFFFWHNVSHTNRRWEVVIELKAAHARNASPTTPAALDLNQFIKRSEFEPAAVNDVNGKTE